MWLGACKIHDELDLLAEASDQWAWGGGGDTVEDCSGLCWRRFVGVRTRGL